jgi:hypothetical protein
MGEMNREERLATAMTLAMAATTIVARTEAGAPTAEALGFQLAHPQHAHRSAIRVPVNIQKYVEETNLGLWLEDYQLSVEPAVQMVMRSSSITSPCTSLSMRCGR